MVKHVKEKDTYNGQDQTILAYIARKANNYTGSMESIRLTVCEDKKGGIALDIRKYVESETFTGCTKQGFKLERHHFIELMSILPDIKEMMEISDDDTDVLDELEGRQKALKDLTA